MKFSGYSLSPLSKKLGLKPGYSLLSVNAPVDYINSLSPLPEQCSIFTEFRPDCDIVHAFYHWQKELEQQYPQLVSSIHRNGMIWISWPKGSSKVPTDLNRDWIREYILDQGLVDVKVASYDDVYSGLKFVYRLKDR